MKIKTICFRLDNANNFDQEVNAALEKGWQLVKRSVLPARQLTDDTYLHAMLYAELVMLDPVPEPEPVQIDPIEIMQTIRAECKKCRDCDQCRWTDLCDPCFEGTPEYWTLPCDYKKEIEK